MDITGATKIAEIVQLTSVTPGKIALGVRACQLTTISWVEVQVVRAQVRNPL